MTLSVDKRELVLPRQAGRDAPTTVTTRWAKPYLRGALTRERPLADDSERPSEASRFIGLFPFLEIVPAVLEVRPVRSIERTRT